MPHEDGEEEPKPWVLLTAALLLLIPFFFASWWIEYQIAKLMLSGIGPQHIDDAVFAGNLVTYGIMAFLLLGAFVWDSSREEVKARISKKFRSAAIKEPISTALSIVGPFLQWILPRTFWFGIIVFAGAVVLGGPALLGLGVYSIFWEIDVSLSLRFLDALRIGVSPLLRILGWVMLLFVAYHWAKRSLFDPGGKAQVPPHSSMEAEAVEREELNGGVDRRPLPNAGESRWGKVGLMAQQGGNGMGQADAEDHLDEGEFGNGHWPKHRSSLLTVSREQETGQDR